jgi:hypothetical protein
MREQLKPKFGIVAMLDALGVRNATIGEASEFIESIQMIMKETPQFLSGLYKGDKKETKKIEVVPPHMSTFGDTVIFTWEMDEGELPDFLPDVGFTLAYTVFSGLEFKLAFRGALSVGEYIQSGSTVLGPAVADVASWYDCAEMIGVVATPYCGQILNAFDHGTTLNNMDFVKYKIPLKGDSHSELWTVPWPHFLTTPAEKAKKKPMQLYYEIMQQFLIPKGTEQKYFNTEVFAKYVLSLG